MDLNLVILCGRLATNAEVRQMEAGSTLLQLLITVQREHPHRRTEVIPVSVWNPPDELIEALPQAGERIWVSGAVQRRYWQQPNGGRSRIEVVADSVTRPGEALDEPAC